MKENFAILQLSFYLWLKTCMSHMWKVLHKNKWNSSFIHYFFPVFKKSKHDFLCHRCSSLDSMEIETHQNYRPTRIQRISSNQFDI